MAITRQKGELVCTCNECGVEFYGGTQDDFRAFVEELKEEGWRITKNGDIWEHYCPDCEDGP